MRIRSAVLVLLVACVAGCSLGERSTSVETPTPGPASAHARPPAPPASGALTRIPDGPAARRRLAFVSVGQLGAAELPFNEKSLLRAVLGAGAATVSGLPDGSAETAVQVGQDATVLRGSGAGGLDGVPSGDDGVIVGVTGAAAEALADSYPETTAITAIALRAVQSCLGDTLAQTIAGPATMGEDAALGVGLAQDETVGLQLRICAAPRLFRQLDPVAKTLERELGATVTEEEIVEREVVRAVIAADALPARQVLDLLSAGPALRALAWR